MKISDLKPGQKVTINGAPAEYLVIRKVRQLQNLIGIELLANFNWTEPFGIRKSAGRRELILAI